MRYQDLIATARYCLDIRLSDIDRRSVDGHKDPSLFDQIQYLFQEIFIASKYDPNHIFTSQADYHTLYCIARNAPMQEAFYKFGIEYLNPQPIGRIDGIRNLTTGDMVHVASLPDLENGNMRVGFFPVRFEFSQRYE